jgi:hypothetical protein
MKMGVSINRDTPKWVVDNGKPIKMDDSGVPPWIGNLHMIVQSILSTIFGDYHNSLSACIY